MKPNGKCPRGRLRLRWEEQVRKGVMQWEGRTWEEMDQEIWKDRWRGLVAGNVEGRCSRRFDH
jgi:hypothetical protein